MRCDLSYSNLSHAKLTGVNLSGADLTHARLNGADLTGATLSNAKLSGADMAEAVIGATIFSDIDLSEANGLDRMRHKGPSSIGLDTLYKSQGRIPDEFLKAAGVPDEVMEHLIRWIRNAARWKVEGLR